MGMNVYLSVSTCTSRLQQIRLLQGTVDIDLQLSIHASQPGHLFWLQPV